MKAASNLSRLLLSLCSLLLVFGLAACGGSPRSTTANKENTAATKDEQKLDEEVFPKDKVVDVKITIDETDFQDMLDNASAEEFKTASVDYNGQHFDNIGIRTKGNLSLRSVVQMPDSDRYSFKLSFDEYVDQTLDGVSKINLNNNYSDASYMREFLAYELAGQMGLPTPKYSYVNVYINDELWGFYLAVEQIGDAYLERHFGNSYGALYKGEMTGSGSDLTWLGDDPDLYTGLALKSKTTNGDILIDMLDELNNGTDYEKVLDVEESLGYIALNVLTNNTDSYIGGNKQNYYLYEDDGIFSVLPWDYNMAFGGLGGGGGMGGFGGGMGGRDRGNAEGDDGGGDQPAEGAADAGAAKAADVNGASAATGGAAAEAGAGKAGAAPGGRGGGGSLLIDEPTQGAVAERPLVAKLLAVDEYKELYHSILQEAVDGYLSNDAFTARVNELYEMIASYVKADPRPFYTYEEFEEAVPALISTNASQVENIAQQLDGTLPSAGDGSGSGGMGGGPGGERPAFGNADGDAVGQAGQGAAAPDGQQPQMPPDGFGGEMPGGQPTQGDGGATGNADGQAGQADADAQQGARGQGGGRGFGGGGPMGDGGGPGGFGEGGARQAQTNPNEAIAAGISLLVVLLACVFVAFFRRKRL
ncbi:CotH kinase family protein [Paenibacillus sp. M1]|uniref:CotH kinase family protein n=1 Tax=Paenibacillus haidiansis TaxID=1574488 RepID=A0ABU7VWW0_9BACL